MNVICFLIAGVAFAFNLVLIHAIIRQALENGKEFGWTIKRIKRFLCDVFAIGGAWTSLLACLILMVQSFMRLFG